MKETTLDSRAETKDELRYPEHPITVIVAYKEGGGTDKIARAICSVAEKYIGTELIIKNIPGADGELGYMQICTANPDGYTIGFINLPTFVSIPQGRKTLYSDSDIEPVMNVVYDPSVLAVRSDSRLVDFQAFIDWARENPFALTVGNNGYGASNHVAAAELAKGAHIDVQHIPFGGSADMIRALEEGYVDSMIAKQSEISELEKQGKVRLLCSFTETRLEPFPDTPTLRELGIDIEFGSARALAAPKDTPHEIIEYLHQAFRKTLEDDEMKRLSKELDIPLMYIGPDELARYIERWREYAENTVPTLPL